MLDRRNLLRFLKVSPLLGALGVAEDQPDAIVQRLMTVPMFAFGGVGFAGRPSKGELDYKLMLRQPPSTALETFEKMYSSGTPQAKAYALVGMKRLDPKRYQQLLSEAANSKEVVQVMRGCILFKEPLPQLAKEIDTGKY